MCTKIVLNVKTKQKQLFVYTTCSAGILSSWCKNKSFWPERIKESDLHWHISLPRVGDSRDSEFLISQWLFGNFNSKKKLLKSGSILDKVTKLGKATQDVYNWVGWLILWAHFKNWVAEGIASEVNDSTKDKVTGSICSILIGEPDFFMSIFCKTTLHLWWKFRSPHARSCK